MRLSKIQSGFRDLMLAPPATLQAVTADFSAQFAVTDIDLPTRLDVYRSNILGSLVDALIATFPLVRTLVGPECFEALARRFVLQNPPQRGCLNLYGQGFDEFIASYVPTQDLVYLRDVAVFEIALNAAYYAADDAPLTAAQLAALSPEILPDTVLELRANVHIVQSSWPLAAIRDFCHAGDLQGTLDMARGGGAVLVQRPALEVLVAPLTADDAAMLQAIGRGRKLGSALENTLAAHPQFAMADFLSRHLANKIFRAIPAVKP